MSPLPPQPLSPLDGRYRTAVETLGEHLSEAALNRARVHVEVEWLIALAGRGLFGAAPVEAEKAEALRAFAADFPTLLEGEVDLKQFTMISTPQATHP